MSKLKLTSIINEASKALLSESAREKNFHQQKPYYERKSSLKEMSYDTMLKEKQANASDKHGGELWLEKVFTLRLSKTI